MSLRVLSDPLEPDGGPPGGPFDPAEDPCEELPPLDEEGSDGGPPPGCPDPPEEDPPDDVWLEELPLPPPDGLELPLDVGSEDGSEGGPLLLLLAASEPPPEGEDDGSLEGTAVEDTDVFGLDRTVVALLPC